MAKVADFTASSEVSGRPRSLFEVEQASGSHGTIDALLRECLDEFYVEVGAEARRLMLDAEPVLTGNDRADAHIGAVGEHLARRNGLAVPHWTSDRRRFLKRPYFPAGLESLKATLIVESPTAFRRRMICVEEDPLYRPRCESRGFGSKFSEPST